MVGWSRRNREASERRARWWASLTPQEQEEALARERAADKIFFRGFAIFIGILVALMTIIAFCSQR